MRFALIRGSAARHAPRLPGVLYTCALHSWTGRCTKNKWRSWASTAVADHAPAQTAGRPEIAELRTPASLRRVRARGRRPSWTCWCSCAHAAAPRKSC
eukprot:14866602-Alexandrium_andersonii.AAC.1